MLSIKFTNATSVILKNDLTSDTIAPSIDGVFTVTEPLSKNNIDFYHFQITGSNVSVSGQITEVHRDYQFFNLFAGCKQITNASQLILSAPTMKKFCYANMFLDCVNLINPPQLQATTLAEWCYSSMFGNCSSLTSAPVLTATTLAKYCYYCMFYGCSKLTSAPSLPATGLADWCYNSMFYDCNKLNYISGSFTNWSNATTNWVTDVAQEGIFEKVSGLTDTRGVDNIPSGWFVFDNSTEPLSFTGKGVNNSITLKKNLLPYSVNLYYKKNNDSWKKYTIDDTINLSNGDVVSFFGDNERFSKSNNRDYYYFDMTGTIEAKGNIQSLMGFRDKCVDYCYCHLFDGCTSLTTPPELPAELANVCYERMFKGCSNLSTAPQLSQPVNIHIPGIGYQNIYTACYLGMFENCTSLTTPPALPASTLANWCYNSMFAGCTALTTVPTLSSIDTKYYSQFSYAYMFQGCTSLSTVPKDLLPAMDLERECYEGMFAYCSNLTAAPDLPASTLATKCYAEMFKGCSKLSSIDVSFTDWNENLNATTDWVSGVQTNGGTFTKYPQLSTIYTHGVNGIRKYNWIPSGWTVVDKSQQEDYQNMPLTFECIEGSIGFTFPVYTQHSKVSDGVQNSSVSSLYYKKAGDTEWIDWKSLGYPEVTISAGEKLEISGWNGGQMNNGWTNYHNRFTYSGNGKLILYGNISSLFATDVSAICINNIFEPLANTQAASTLIDASKLYIPYYASTGEGLNILGNNNVLSAAPLFASKTYVSNGFNYGFQQCYQLKIIEFDFEHNSSWSYAGLMKNVQTTSGLFIKSYNTNLPSRGTTTIPYNWTVLNRMTDGSLQFAENTTYKGTSYSAGDPFPDDDPYEWYWSKHRT